MHAGSIAGTDLLAQGASLSKTPDAGSEEGEEVAEANGFVAPLFGLMHIDTLRILTRGCAASARERGEGAGRLPLPVLRERLSSRA